MDWPSLLIQIPLVGVFIWYSLELQKRYQSSMAERDTAYLGALNKITECIDTHDSKSAQRIEDARKEAATLVTKSAEIAAQKVLLDAEWIKARKDRLPRSNE